MICIGPAAAAAAPVSCSCFPFLCLDWIAGLHTGRERHGMGREPYAGSAATAFLYRLASVMGGPVCDKKRNRQKKGRKKKKTSSSLLSDPFLRHLHSPLAAAAAAVRTRACLYVFTVEMHVRACSYCTGLDRTGLDMRVEAVEEQNT